MHVRPPAVAGLFYESSPQALQTTIKTYLSEAKAPALTGQTRALIVPHAGYIYSGPVAATAYQMLKGYADRFKRVLLLGPAHRVGFEGIGASTADEFATPLGNIRLDTTAIKALIEEGLVIARDDAHAQEHCLEVQLPFLQNILQDFSLIPLVVGYASTTMISKVIEHFADDAQTLILISSDLSHYLPYASAKERDQMTCKAIESLDSDRLDFEDACGRLPVTGLLEVARHHHWQVKTLDLRNSGDTAGDKSRVVGYGSWVFSEAD